MSRGKRHDKGKGGGRGNKTGEEDVGGNDTMRKEEEEEK